MIQDENEQYFPAYDGNGNITSLLNAANKTVTADEYSPASDCCCQGRHAKQNPFRFSTKYWDGESRLVYYGLRYYSPQTGKFINCGAAPNRRTRVEEPKQKKST